MDYSPFDALCLPPGTYSEKEIEIPGIASTVFATAKEGII
jgi:hypothetical protein